jgi:hypothetical protein
VKHILAVVAVILFLSSCSDELDKGPADSESGSLSRYFPLDSGSYIVYSVDSIIHRYEDDHTNEPDSMIDTFHYEVKEVIDSDFIDGEGDLAWRVSRYYRDNDSAGWNFTSLWTAKRTNQSAQKVEENIRFVKLSFPVTITRTWNGNQFNFFPEEDYSVDELNVPLNIGGFSFDSSVTVLELEDFNLIHRIFKEEKYVYGLGLAYRQRDSLNINGLGYVTNGVEFRQSLIDYFPK